MFSKVVSTLLEILDRQGEDGRLHARQRLGFQPFLRFWRAERGEQLRRV